MVDAMTEIAQPETRLARNPEELLEIFAVAFNAGDYTALPGLFAPDALQVMQPGQPIPVAATLDNAAQSLEHRLPITVNVRHVYTVGDIALLIADYVHEGPGPDGELLRIAGTAADILVRGPDGYWRCLISNPAGTTRA